MDDIYHIHVQGHLADCWSDWLGSLVIHQQDDGTTVLVGPIVDQAALHGVLARIRDLGLVLLAVERNDAGPGETSGTPPAIHTGIARKDLCL